MVACASAAGFALPPMVIWDRQTLSPEVRCLVQFMDFLKKVGLIVNCLMPGLITIFCVMLTSFADVRWAFISLLPRYN